MDHQRLHQSFRALANPTTILAPSQHNMLSNYQKDVNRQKESKTQRLLILDRKRQQRSEPEVEEEIVVEIVPEEVVPVPPEEPKKEKELFFEPPPLPPSKFEIEDGELTEDEEEEEEETSSESSASLRHQRPKPTSSSRSSLSSRSRAISVAAARRRESRTPSVASSATSSLDSELYQNELADRLRDVGVTSATDKTARSQELAYWRKKVSMEEESAVKQAGMLLTMLSSFLESFTSAIGFNLVRTSGLSTAIQTALESGDFDLAIKSYCVNPSAISMLKNPVASFLTSFGHVMLRTHLDNIKKDLEKGIQTSLQVRPAAPPPMPQYVPQYIPQQQQPVRYQPQPEPVRYQQPFQSQTNNAREVFHPGRVTTPWDAREELLQAPRRPLVVPDNLMEPVSIVKAVQDKMSPLVPVLTSLRSVLK